MSRGRRDVGGGGQLLVVHIESGAYRGGKFLLTYVALKIQDKNKEDRKAVAGQLEMLEA
jgi:hypothetical protein